MPVIIYISVSNYYLLLPKYVSYNLCLCLIITCYYRSMSVIIYISVSNYYFIYRTTLLVSNRSEDILLKHSNMFIYNFELYYTLLHIKLFHPKPYRGQNVKKFLSIDLNFAILLEILMFADYWLNSNCD